MVTATFFSRIMIQKKKPLIVRVFMVLFSINERCKHNFTRPNRISFGTNKEEALLVAAEGGYKDIVNLLIDMGVKVNSIAIERAASKGHIDLIKLLMNRGVRPNSFALKNAVINGYLDIVKLLIDEGVDPNFRDIGSESALDYAVSCNQIDVVDLLLSQVYNQLYSGCIDGMFQSNLERAADHGNFEIVRLLLDHGADPNLTYALFFSVKRGYTDIVKLLVERGANPNGNRGDDNTVIAAVANNHMDILELLLNNGANIEGSDFIGDTGLSYAVKYGRDSQVEWLLNIGAKVNELVKRRALKRSNPNVCDVFGRSMIDEARSKGCAEYIIKMLEKA